MNEVVIEFTEDNLNRFLNEYYSTHRKTRKPIVESPISRSMNKILIVTNRIVQNNHKKYRGLYASFIIKELGIEKIGICSTDLSIEYVFPTKVRHDLDNYLGGIKEVLDSFSDLGVIIDDNYEIIKSIRATARYEKGVSKMVLTFSNCKYDIVAMNEAMAKEKVKREKREESMKIRKKSKANKKTKKK